MVGDWQTQFVMIVENMVEGVVGVIGMCPVTRVMLDRCLFR